MTQTLGESIREKRLARGLSLGQLASAVSTSMSRVRSWERDEAVPTADELTQLAESLGVRPEELADLVVEAAIEEEDASDESPTELVSATDESPTELVSAAAGVSMTSVSQPHDEEVGAVEDAVEEGPPLPEVESVEEPEQELEDEGDDEDATVEEASVWEPAEPSREEPIPAAASGSPRPVPLRYPESAPVGVAVEISETAPNPWNPLRYLFDPEKPWLYWVRAALTVLVLLVLLSILFNSIGDLFDKIGELLDTINPTEPVEGGTLAP